MALLGARAGLKVSLELLFRISVLIQLFFGIFGSLFLYVAPERVTIVGVLPLLAVCLHIFHYAAIFRATLVRNPYPWRIFKWTFLVATCLYYAPTIAQTMALVSKANVNPLALLLLFVSLLPGLCQIVLLWWPPKIVPTPDTLDSHETAS